MKTKVFYIASLLVLLLISVNVSASSPELKKHKNISNDMLASRYGNVHEIRHHRSGSGFERWMTNVDLFNHNEMNTFEDQAMESWMKSLFTAPVENSCTPQQDVKIENWMKDISEFNNTMEDTDPEIESWMYQVI